MKNKNKSANTGSTLFITGVSIVAALGGFLFGFDSGVINGTIEGLQTAFNSTSVGTGFNVASILLGCAVGAFFAGRLADKYGRKALLIVASLFFIVSAWGSGISDTSLEFIIYRIIGGLAVGAASVMTPAYISEIAPANLRGRLSSLQQVAISLGLFMAFMSNYIIASTAGSSIASFWLGIVAWRWMYWVEIIPAIAFFIGLLVIPESPRYYVLNDQKDEALEVLMRLYGLEMAQKKIGEIAESFGGSPQLSDLWDSTTKKIKPIVWIGLGLAILQQFVGINVIKYYGAVIWKTVGFTESNALLINIISEAVGLMALAVALTSIDRIGRKLLLLIGSIGMTITLAIVAYVFSTATMGPDSVALSPTMGLVALVVVNAYVFFFSLSWGPVMWVMLGEMFPNQIRGSGLAVSGVGQWLSNFGVTMSFPILLATVGLTGSYSIYAVFGLLSVVFVLAFVPETKGRELEDMDSLLGSEDLENR